MKITLDLIRGELRRLLIYKIIPVSLATSILWVLLFLFLSKEDAGFIAPLLLFVDVTMMTVLLIGASHHLEKQEGTIRSMMVMPVTLMQILGAKFLASLFLGLQALAVISLALYFIHGIVFNYGLMLMFVLLAAAAHGTIGFLLAHNSKDFTTMLGLMMIYVFLFSIPSVLFFFGIVDSRYEWLMMLSPAHASSTLINAVFEGNYPWKQIAAGIGYLVGLSAVLMKFAVYPAFKRNAVRGS